MSDERTWVGAPGAPVRIPGHVGTYWLGDAPEYRKTATVRAIQMEGDFEVDTPEGLHSGKAGDWLAQGPAGELWPIKRDIFEATYEPV